MVTRLEALAAAFANMNGALDPTSDAFQAKNPLLLKAFSQKHVGNEKGLRVFKTYTAGWDNGLIDLTIKCSGKSFFGRLTPESTIADLVRVYGNQTAAARKIVNFLRHALADDSISEHTPLKWVLESQVTEIPTEVSNG